MKHRFAFLAGLPRTGSTLLGALLSQHPDLHPTRTSIVRNLMRHSLEMNLGESPYFNVKDPDSQVWGIMKGVLFGAYEKVDAAVILEKDRGWVMEIPTLRRILGGDPKIVAPVRPVPEIISSFILISRKNGKKSKIEEEVISSGKESNSWTLSRVIWEKYIYGDWKRFKAAYETYPECFLLVDYGDLIKDPTRTVQSVHSFLGVPKLDPVTEGLTNPNPENDSIYGIPGLHDIRPELSRTSPSALEVLGQECYDFWAGMELEFWRGKK